MLIIIVLLSFILSFIFPIIAAADWKHDTVYFTLTFVFLVIGIISLITGCFTGFVNQPKTEGIHQGVITAVDLEGVYFRRYEVYLKSSGYTNQSDETIYKLYEHETELAEQLINAIGKTVKIYYGHDGGYIGWNSCGTYHIKRVEVLEGEQ